MKRSPACREGNVKRSPACREGNVKRSPPCREGGVQRSPPCREGGVQRSPSREWIATKKCLIGMERVNALAPCGVFCGACPSYEKSCYGCASEDRDQARQSKWSCSIRNCCYHEKGLDFCIECEEFPCLKIKKKLINSHRDNPKFHYRHEIPEVFSKLREMTLSDFLQFQKQRWTCNRCGGTIRFYHYACDQCGRSKLVR